MTVNKQIFRIVIDGTIKDFPCSEWEVNCILVPASTTKKFVEFKKYSPDGKQVLESHYVNHFEILNQ